MKLHRLRLENYRRHLETEVEFADGLTALVGSNGSGKSTLLEAVGFALFGASATRTGKELLRSEDAALGDTVAVELSFTLADSTFEVRRELKGKNLTPSATVVVNGTPIVAPGSGSDGAATEELQTRIGMDKDAFFTTVVARQKELNKLADLGPVDRKRLLLRMLNVDAVDGAINAARNKRRNAENFLEGLRAGTRDLAAIEETVSRCGAASEQAEAAKIEANKLWLDSKNAFIIAEKNWQELSTHQQKFRAHGDEIKLLLEQVRHAGIAANDAQQQWLQARQATGKLAALGKAREEWERAQELGRLETERARLKQQISSLRQDLPLLRLPPEQLFVDAAKEAFEAAQVEQSNARAAVLSGKKKLAELSTELNQITKLGTDAPCPTCKRPMEEHLPSLTVDLQESMAKIVAEITEAEATFSRLQTEQKQAKDELARLEAEVKEAEKSKLLQDQFQRRKAELEEELAKLPAAIPDWEEKLQLAKTAHEQWLHWNALAQGAEARGERANETAALLAAARTKLESLQAMEILDRGAEEADAKRVLDAAKDAERGAERKALEADSQAKICATELSAAKARITEAQLHQEKIRASEEDARYWAALAGARGGGLLDAFKDHLVGRIGPAVSAEASRLMALFTNGRYSEIVLDADYKITVADQGIAYPLERFSGGESDLVHLALRLAVSRLIAERSGADLQFLALDEVFGSLDESRQQSVLAALHSLRGLYAQVLLVTHHDGLREGLDATMVVQEVDGRVSVHNG